MTQPEQESEVDRMAWEDALSDPRTKAALDEGLKDLAEGRVGPLRKKTDQDETRRLCEEYRVLTGQDLGVVALTPTYLGIIMYVEEGMPDEFKEILEAAIPETQINIREIPQNILERSSSGPNDVAQRITEYYVDQAAHEILSDEVLQETTDQTPPES